MKLSAMALFSLAHLISLPAMAAAPGNVPRGIALAEDGGRVDSSQQINLTVVLKLHNPAEFEKVVQDLYDSKSPNYRHWLSDRDLEKYAPTAAELETVKKELVSHGFTVISSNRFSVRVHGTTGNAEEAFQTEIHSFNYKGKRFQAQIRDAELTGAAGSLVGSVAGLERHQTRALIKVATNPHTGKVLFKKAVTSTTLGSTLLGTMTNTAISAPAAFTYNTDGAELPVGNYFGNVYDVNPNLIVGYAPADLQRHYGLTSLYSGGYDGTGQTIALVEAFGYAAAESDANAAASMYGLPPLSSTNFSVVYPEGLPANPADADLTGWTEEIALDIQTAHAIAPGAKILVVASAGQDNEDQIASLQYIIDNKAAYSVSSSWENDDEIISGSAEENAFSTVLELGSAQGISFQFSSGDGGDLGMQTPIGAVSVPSNSPWATAVGGTSILNDPTSGADIVAGWGNDIGYLSLGGPTDPPSDYSFFDYGAGGGESQFFAKPSWQQSLTGNYRQVPDVSALADPFTGVAIVYTDQGTQYLEEGIGGTSLASPIFSAIWAIANQYNGAPLGLAAPAVAKLNAGQITDVLPTSSLNATDVAGTVVDSNGTTFYSATAIFTQAPLDSQTLFPSAIWPVASNEAIAITFGTDSSLTVTPGWDNVTGWGEPNGMPFIQGVTGKKRGSRAAIAGM